MGDNVNYKVFRPNDINYLFVSKFQLINSISTVWTCN